jgi:hypothetical protein
MFQIQTTNKKIGRIKAESIHDNLKLDAEATVYDTQEITPNKWMFYLRSYRNDRVTSGNYSPTNVITLSLADAKRLRAALDGMITEVEDYKDDDR